MRKLFFYLICFCVIAFSACTDELSQDNMDDIVPQQNIKVQEKDASSQQAANDVYNALMNSFVNTSVSTRGTTQFEYIYPENYGGAYINEQGKLVIKIKGDESQMNSYMSNISTSDANVTYEKCNYSMNELYKIYSLIIDYKRANTNSISDNYSYVAISQTNNKVVVDLKDCSDIAINQFKKEINDSPAILFKESKGEILLISTDVNPGSQIVGSYGKGSVDYRAKDKDGNEGIVTCAHVIGNNADLKIGSTVIGKCTNWSFGGHVDPAFCKITNSIYKPTNFINTTTNQLSTSVSWPAETTVINKCGAKTGLTSGTITDATATCWSKHHETGKTIEITDVTKAKINAYKGDSGGIVYTYVSSTKTRYTVGIMNAIEVEKGTETPTGYSYYIKAPYINSVFHFDKILI